MLRFSPALFIRIIFKNKEAYLLKIISLSIAFSCSGLIILFALSEFRFDRYHDQAGKIFRILQYADEQNFAGNRLTNQIPPEAFFTIAKRWSDSLYLTRLKVLHDVNVISDKTVFHDETVYASDPDVLNVLTFRWVNDAPGHLDTGGRSMIISSRLAREYFGTSRATGKSLKIVTWGDTLQYTISGVFEDFPVNSHRAFGCFIRFDRQDLQSLHFDPDELEVYGKCRLLAPRHFELVAGHEVFQDAEFRFQPLPDIYFGKRVAGEEVRHGDYYSVLIMICLAGLILFLALTSYVNLTTLTLPHRAREIAIKKLAGGTWWSLLNNFALESFAVVGASLLLGGCMMIIGSNVMTATSMHSILSLLSNEAVGFAAILFSLAMVAGAAPLMMIVKFARASPTRLLSTDTISFPRFKRAITFTQLGISMFLIVTSLVVRRQISFSLLKEPGRNHEQVVYLPYPTWLTNEGLLNLRHDWKKYNPNIVDVMAVSQLPNHINSKALNNAFYFLAVDPAFQEFFNLSMLDGRWFKANDPDSLWVVNPAGLLAARHSDPVIGVIQDVNHLFHQPTKPTRFNLAPYYDYHFLCIRVLEVDIKKTMGFLAHFFNPGESQPTIFFMDPRFGEWMNYQQQLNDISEVLAIVSVLLSGLAIYGLSIAIVRDKLKHIAIRKLFGADVTVITRLLLIDFARQLGIAVLLFGPLAYIFIHEFLRNFVYATHFEWMDPALPIGYCAMIITLICSYQANHLNQSNLTAALKS